MNSCNSEVFCPRVLKSGRVHWSILLDRLLQSDKPKLALGGKAVSAGKGTKYKFAGAKPADGFP